jgi:hypothetical protein
VGSAALTATVVDKLPLEGGIKFPSKTQQIKIGIRVRREPEKEKGILIFDLPL